MKIEIIQETKNPFFKRKDLTVLIRHEEGSTPSKAELIKQVAVKSAVDESQVVVDYITTKKGICESTAKVKVLNEKPPVKQEAQPAATPAEGGA